MTEIDRSARLLASLGGLEGAIYSVTFSAVAISAVQDAIAIVAPATHFVKIRGIWLGQYTDFGDAAAEIISVLVTRGYATAGSGGNAFTPIPLVSGGAPALTTARINDTTPASTGTVVSPVSRTWNVQAPFVYDPRPVEAITLAKGERAVVRLTAPADAITTNGELIFEEYR